MKYIIKFHNKEFIKVPNDVGEKIKAVIRDGGKHFEYGDNFYATSGVSSIELIKGEQKTMLPEHTENPVKKETLDRLGKELKEKYNW